jgi:uncharacterized protein with PQ loop repeat
MVTAFVSSAKSGSRQPRDASRQKPPRPLWTTPTWLSFIRAGLVVLIVGSGFAAVLVAWTRSHTLRDISDRWEPMLAASQEAYVNLSEASATAVRAFLADDLSAEQELQKRYETSLARAAAAIVKVASDADMAPYVQDQIDVLTKEMPVYTGLVTSAWVNDEFGVPVGGDYLRQSDDLMRSAIRPAAQKLNQSYLDRLTSGQDRASGVFSWLMVIPASMLLIALLVAQMYLARKTKRVVNGGLLIATIAVVAAMVWSILGILTSGSITLYAKWSGSKQVDMLVQTKTMALTCRTNEMLALVPQRNVADDENKCASLGATIVGDEAAPGVLLTARYLAADPGTAKHIDDALEGLQSWVLVQERIRETDGAKKRVAAVRLAVGNDKDGALVPFEKMTENLDAAITQSMGTATGATSVARSVLTWPLLSTIVLTLIAITATLLGIARRIGEYR